MQEKQADIEVRDYFKDSFTAAELSKLIGTRPISDFISTRAKSYKESGWDKKPPTKKQAIAAMIEDPTLLRRPILIKGSRILIGFSQLEYEKVAR